MSIDFRILIVKKILTDCNASNNFTAFCVELL
jgi:hypothetical protein